MPRDYLSDDFQEDSSQMAPRDFLMEDTQQSNKMNPQDFAKGSDMLRDMVYGFGKSVGNIGKLLTGAKSDTSGADFRKQHPNTMFNSPQMNQLDKFGKQINPTFEMPDIRSKNSNPVAVAIGQYAPFGIAGGTSLIGSTAAAGAYGLTQHEPGQKGFIDEKLGMPSNRATSAIEDAMIASILHGLPTSLSSLNPAKYTSKNIAKNIISTGEQNKELYSGEYKKLFNEAQNKGFDNISSIVPEIDIKTLRKFSPKKSINGVENFVDSPTLENAHLAKSDLLRMQRDLGKLTTFRTAERQQSKAVSDAIDSIQSNMFKDKAGNINQDLLSNYNGLQKGYATDVIPYKNKAINKYKRNEISSKELVNSLKKGEFAAKKGSEHPELFMPDKIKAAITALGIGGGAIEAGKYLNNKINN